MSLEFRLIGIERRDPVYIAAMDQAIYEECSEGRSPPTLVYHNWDPSITIAKNQLLTDLNLEKCDMLGYKVVRVGSGGKAVVHFPDTEFSYSLFIPSSGKIDITRVYQTYCGKICDALTSLGLPLVRVEKNDIYVGNKKIGGNAQVVKKHATMQHGLILYEKPDAQTMLDFMDPSLYPPHAVNELDEILTGFTSYSQTSQEELLQRMTEHLTGNSYTLGILTPEENERITQLVSEYSVISKGTTHVPLGLCWYPAPAYVQWKGKRNKEAILHAQA